MVSVDVKQHVYLLTCRDRSIVEELCESRGGCPGAVRPNEPCGFRGRKAILNHALALPGLSLSLTYVNRHPRTLSNTTIPSDKSLAGSGVPHSVCGSKPIKGLGRRCCMSVDILGTSWDQCRSMVQYSFTSTETRRLVRTDSPGRPPRLSHSSCTMIKGLKEHYLFDKTQQANFRGTSPFQSTKEHLNNTQLKNNTTKCR